MKRPKVATKQSHTSARSNAVACGIEIPGLPRRQAEAAATEYDEEHRKEVERHLRDECGKAELNGARDDHLGQGERPVRRGLARSRCDPQKRRARDQSGRRVSQGNGSADGSGAGKSGEQEAVKDVADRDGR
jgi:hypothetical protein